MTHTINHEEVGHNEQYVIKEAWTETVTEDVYDPLGGAACLAERTVQRIHQDMQNNMP